MYKRILRPILFLVSPERIHHIIIGMLRFAGWVPGGRALIRMLFAYRDPSLEREVFGIRFPNPVGMAAGFDKNACAYREIAAMGFGHVEIGTVTPRPQPGNPKPRLFRLPKDRALINRMGFNNSGVEQAVARLRYRKPGVIVGGNLGKNTLTPNENAAADYLKLFRNLYEYVDYFVVNVSCPNVADLNTLAEKKNLTALMNGLLDFRRGQDEYRPILLKISPDLTAKQIDEAIEVLVELCLDGIVATNTTIGREGLTTDPQTVAGIGNGGLSGAPLTERSLELVRYIHQKTEGRYPIIGVGGIMTPEDAERMLDAGASLIQVYTGFIYEGPCFVRRINRHLARRA